MPRLLLALTFTLLACTNVPGQAPTPGYFFVQLSDTQLGMFAGNRDFIQETANFEFAVANINRLQPDFVIITGDLVNKPGDAAQMAEYERIKGLIAPSIRVYDVPGNHDVDNAPTPAGLAAYRQRFGEDHYMFRHRNLLGIVLNSSLIHTPDGASEELDRQDAWLREELARARTSNARHVVVFQHHPWFIQKADEPDEYFNIPLARRMPLLALFREAGIRTLVSGHYHRNAVASDAGFDMITTGPVSMPIGDTRSGLRVFYVTDDAIAHRYFEFGAIPNRLDPANGL